MTDSRGLRGGAARRAGLLLLFFLSGISGLVYQIAWVRQSIFTFGVSVYAYSTVIGAYMIGLALGSYAMGRRIDAHAHPLRSYAGLEVGIAALAALSPFLLASLHGLYPAFNNALPAGSFWLTLGRLVFSLAALTPATFLIGATLPVMSRIFATQGGRVGSDVGRLFLVNTAGAAVGCVLAGLVLLRLLGARETIFVGAGINLFVAVGALALAWLPRAGRAAAPRGRGGAEATPAAESVLDPTTDPAAEPRRGERTEAARPISAGALRYVAIAYGISGFVALGYEIVWARILYVHSSHAAYSFPLMLTVFLTGLALGSAGTSRILRRRRATLTHFGLIQLSLGVLAVLILHLFARLPALHLQDAFGGYTIPYEFLVAFSILLPPTLLLGALFPIVGSLYTRERAKSVGLRIGRVNALNTLGAIAGSLGAGFVLVPLLGLRNTTVALAALNLALGAVALRFERHGGDRHGGAGRRAVRWAPAGAGALVILTVAILPTGFYLGSYYTETDRLVFYKEGVETTVAVLEVPEDNYKISFVNGRDEVPTDRASMAAFRLLGHLPPLLRPGARNALVLSFGNGIATGTMNTHGIPVIDAVDLSPEMIEAAAVYAAENYAVLESDHLRLHVEDGRNFLLRAETPYDIISVDATHPANASSWALFTSEFYRLIESKLAEDGVFMQWIPLHGVRESDYRNGAVVDGLHPQLRGGDARADDGGRAAVAVGEGRRQSHGDARPRVGGDHRGVCGDGGAGPHPLHRPRPGHHRQRRLLHASPRLSRRFLRTSRRPGETGRGWGLVPSVRQAGRSAEPALEGRGGAAEGGEAAQKTVRHHVIVAQLSNGDEVLAPEILNQRMIHAEAPWRPDERVARELEGGAKLGAAGRPPPGLRILVDGLADLAESRPAGAPGAATHEAAPGLDVQVEAGSMGVLARFVSELDAGGGLVGGFVSGEAGVAVDPEERAAICPRVCEEVGADPLQGRGEVGDEAERRLFDVRLVS